MTNKQKKRIFLRALVSVIVFMQAIFTSAQTKGLLLRYDFSNVKGSSVYDASSSGVTAPLMNDAAVENMGDYNVLNLGSGTGYLDMTSAAGAKLKAQDNYSISVYYRVDKDASLSGNGYFLWTFSTSSACSSSAGKYSAYRLNSQRVATSTGGSSNETGAEVGSASSRGSWIHLVYTEEDGVGKVYINGSLAYTVSDMPANSSNYGSDDISYCWIGRPQFSGDNYLKNTLVYDFRLYGKALTEDEISTLANVTESLDYQYERGTTGDNSSLLSAIASARSFINSAGANYPDDAIKDLSDYVEYCEHIAYDGYSQTLMDEAVANLNEAVDAVESVKGFVFDDSNVVTSFETDRGFKHPGILHTQDDFDRIKQQLADGNEKVTAAYNVLKNAAYAQSTAATYPSSTIVRGGSSGQNYINAARGATIAYQNGLRWKIEGNTDCAQHAIDVLMAWVNTCTALGGDSNYALAAGLYGYEFANAAELVRDYNNWDQTEDFKKVQDWFRNVWYPYVIGFLRGRNGTWENAGKWWQAPGHYWSNWGLCNDMCLISMGILCDDPFMYNQGMSFYKYDQCNTWSNLDPNNLSDGYVWNWGLTEYIGNLVPIESDCPDGLVSPFGKLSQMQETGRDQGHSLMALGLAVDICQVGWNQGDDLFSYMDNRLAGGIEHVAAYNHANIDNVPFVTYRRQDSGYTLADGRGGIMTEVSSGGRGQVRPFWGRVIGHYEGVKGIKMTYSEMALDSMGIDGGGAGGTSGGYDHLGYSVLTCTRDGMATSATIPTLLTPKMQYNGQVIEHNELGGLVNTYKTNTNTCLEKGGTVVLMPQLPEGVANTGNWRWNTGETTQNLTVSTDKSYLYRVTYTNANGVESEQVFTIAVDGDCAPTLVEGSIYCNDIKIGENSATVEYGSPVTLNATAKSSFGDEIIWSNGQTGGSITLNAVTSDRVIKALHRNQGGAYSEYTFNITVTPVSDEVKDLSKGQIYYDITDAVSPFLSTSETYNWTNSGMSLNTGAGNAPYNNSDGAEITFPFFEKWTAKGGLANADIHQTIDNLPNGSYYIGGSFIATLQSNASADIEGAYFYAGDQQVSLSTLDALPEIYSLKVDVTDNTLTFGLKTEGTNANWVAMDNLFIYFAGTKDKYLAKATTENPARMVVKNPRMESASGWSASPTINYNTAEYYQTTFDINQTIKNAPAGMYSLQAQAFQRNGSPADSYAAYNESNPSEGITSFIYANSDSAAVAHIASAAQTAKLGGSESAVGNPTVYIPNNMEAASIYFGNGLYDNSMDFETSEESDITIGLKSSTYSSAYWTMYDNVRLLYYGVGGELLSYKQTLDSLETVANNYIESKQMPKASLSILSNAVDNYYNTYSTVAEYETAIAGLTEAVSAATSMNDEAVKYAALLEYISKLYNTDYNELTTGAHNTFGDSINAINTDYQTITQTSDITAIKQRARNAAYEYICNADPASDCQFDLTFMLTNPDVTEYWNGEWNVRPEGWYNEQNGGNFQVMANTNMGSDGEVFMEYWSATAATNGFTLCQKITLPAGTYAMSGLVGAHEYDNKGTNTNITFSANDIDGTQIGYNTLHEGQIDFVQTEEEEVKIGLKAHAGNNNRWMAINDIHLYKNPTNNITIDENVSYEPVSAAGNVTLTRKINANVLNSLILPFTVSEEDIANTFGEGTIIYNFSESADEEGNVTLNFSSIASISANEPILIRPVNGGTEFTFDGVTIVPATNSLTTAGTYYKFVGTYTINTEMPVGSYYVSNGTLWISKATTGTLKSTRAYITSVDSAASAKSVKITIDGEPISVEEATAINGVKGQEEDVIYTIQGIRTSKLQKGINIVNGKKIYNK